MKTTTDRPQQQTWLGAIAEAAKHQGLELPPFDGFGMGTLRSATTASGRFVTLKRLLGPAAKAKGDGVEWALWHRPDGLPVLVAAFRDPLEPEKESIAVTLSLLKGWLVDQWTPDEAKGAVGKHPGVQEIKEPHHRFADQQSDPVIDTVFREYADLCLRRHRLLSEGKEDSAEVSEVEGRMDALCPKLDEVQRRSLKGMASDLSWIRRKGEPPPKGRKTPIEVSAQEQQELAAAINSKDWHRILHYLRRCAPAFQAASLARERGIAYEAIGLPDYSRVFREKVVEFAPPIVFAPDRSIILSNCARSIDAQVIAAAPKNAVLVWETNGAKVTARTTTEDRLVGAVEYKAA
jgi:hypothetical protein